MKGDDAVATAVRAAGDLSGLSPEALAFLFAEGTLESFEAGAIILAQGADSDHALLILTGEVHVTTDSSHGVVPVATLRGPCLVGEIAALAGLARTATVRAATNVSALRIDRPLLQAAARKTPALLIDVIGRLGERIRRVNGAIGLYTHALGALERHQFDPKILEDLRNPIQDLAEFGETFGRMAEQIVLRRQREDEMASAAIIQRALLPKPADVATTRSADLCASMIPAREVGGDFYDVIELEDGRLAAGIGDVCGKGVPAALFMGITRTLMRINLKDDPDLGRAVLKTNRFLIDDNVSDLFATLFYVIFDPRSGSLDYCSCGHNPPLVRRGDGTVQKLPAGGLPVGIFDGMTPKVHRETLNAGDFLFLYTDGVTEALDARGQEFGEDRLAALLKEGGVARAADWVDLVLASVRRFSAGAPQSDDITCLAMVARVAQGTV
jgi:sigma-B regulation protein RsbU (phosphoserine phosphatase)